MSEDLLVQAVGLHRHYGNHHAVNNVSIQLQRGEVLGLLGPNGAGKSTTMNMLTGNLAPGSGEIHINGIDLLDSPRQAKQNIGYLPEQPPVYRDLSVLEYLKYCARLKHIPKAEQPAAIDQALQRCALGEVRRRLIGNLSKGYQQRVGIAQAIINNPQVVILDEPTVGLDPLQIQEIRKLIRTIGDQHSVILSTHILPEVQTVCDRVQIINDGSTVYEDHMTALSDKTKQYEISFDGDVAASSLQALANVRQAEQASPGSFLLTFDDSEAGLRELHQFACQSATAITRLAPKVVSLEAIFLDLIHGQGEAA